jgi:two-component system sensor histidine kinase PilS (NtrC family)
MLREELVVEGEQRRLMNLVVKESERLNRILDDFLEYASSRTLDAKVVPVRDSVEEVVTLLRNHPDIDSALHIELEADGDSGLIVCIDEEQMKQVYVNLALNAFEAMAHKGTLHIRIGRTVESAADAAESPYVQLFFRDTGPGIDPGHEADIFEPFHTTKPQGTGLGLSIAAKIVESHGGRLEATNHPAGGAEFVIELPEVTGAPVGARPRPVPAQATAVPISAS